LEFQNFDCGIDFCSQIIRLGISDF
jgi:hypothetical protein